MLYMYTKSIILIVLLFFAIKLDAQWYDPDKVDKKAAAANLRAMELAQLQNYKGAIEKLNDAIKYDSKYVDAYLSIGGMYAQLKDYKNSIQFFNTAFTMDTAYTKTFLLPYSISLAGAGKFNDALQAAKKFEQIQGLNEKSLKSAAFRIKSYEFALSFEKKYGNSYQFAPQNLGDSVNTKDSEYFPSLTIDGKQLVFTRRVNNYNEDFYVANAIEKNSWNKAKPLPGDVNTAQNEGAQHISQDGSILFFTGCNLPTGQGSCDLYYSLFINNEWSTPIPAGRNINTEFWESQPSLSPDKRTLYFAGRDPMGLGGSDIYMSTISDKGTWGIPFNLGKKINTIGDESCPFIHADNQTLYFTSTGHQGYGGSDLFMSKKDSANKFGEAVNLGYPINTIENESSMIITADGTQAFYASDRSDTKGGLDLYTFPLCNEMQPTKTLWINGLVYDSLTKEPISGIVELTDANNNKLIQKIQSDENGRFFITLPVDKNYSFTVNRKGYFFYNDTYNLKNAKADFTYTKNIPLLPLSKNTLIVLENIFYESNKFNLKPESASMLNKMVRLLQENPTLSIEIDGHTDNLGVAKNNLLLSNNRAKEVVKYFTSKGIDKARVIAKGFGSTKPIADNKTEIGRAKNRRTEMKVIGI
jgi:outer membrane protein OmpA-like peptidoglycan-associated protein